MATSRSVLSRRVVVGCRLPVDMKKREETLERKQVGYIHLDLGRVLVEGIALTTYIPE